MSTKNSFSKIGVLAATVGASVGLGTVWRFPSEVQSNGGSVFLIAYLLCVVLMGIPVMLAEFSIGRGSRSDALSAFHKLTPGKRWWIVGALSVLAPYLILMYYMVVAGWTIEYMWLSITGELFAGVKTAANEPAFFQSVMEESTTSVWRPVIFTVIMVLINLFILMRGVQKGIERMSNMLMPMLFVILVIFCGVSLNLPNAGEGVKFFLQPDLSKLNGDVLIRAVGQCFFSLSLGMGILITYASYYPKETNMLRTSTTVSLLVLLVAVLTGLIIFPAMKSFGISGDTEGATLIFVTLPQILMRLPWPQVWAVLFFALLAVAALTSTVSIAEVPIALLCDRFGMSRRKSCLIILLSMAVFSTICSLSLGPWSDVTVFGKTIFFLLDYITANIMLPIVTIGICIYVGYVLPRSFFFDETTNRGALRSRMTGVFYWLVRVVAPLLIFIVFVTKLFFE